MMHRPGIHLGLLILFAIATGPGADATVTLRISADRINGSGGGPAPTSTLALIVADTNGDGLATAIAGGLNVNAYFGGPTGDDLILFRADLSAFGSPGVLQTEAAGLDFASDPNLRWNEGDALYLVWFPSLTSATTSLSPGVAYGVVSLGSTPSDGGLTSFTYVSPTNSGDFGSTPLPANAANTLANLTSVPAPSSEIMVTGNGSNIANGSITAATTNHTDFGTTFAAAGGITRTFTIANQGSDNLNLGTVSTSAPAEFSVLSQPTSPVLPGAGTTSFQIRFEPIRSGLRTATVTFATNDGDESPFSFTIQATSTNSQPSDIALIPVVVLENSPPGPVGSLSTTDLDSGETHSYTLVAGAGSTDNALFSISGATLSLLASPNFEATSGSYSIRVRTTDNGSSPGNFEKSFLIAITDLNESPTSLSLNGATLVENNPPGVVVGTFAAADPDAGSSHTFALTGGTGADDNATFSISGNTLIINASADSETKSAYSIRVRATDNGNPGLTRDQVFAISVSGVNEVPTLLTLNGGSLAENGVANATAGTLTAVDPDVGSSHSFALVSGSGGEDNASFSILGNALRITAPANFEEQNSYKVRIRVTDNGGLTLDTAFTIAVTDVNEAPTNLVLSLNSIAENNAPNAIVGLLSASDPDTAASHTFSLVAGSGDTGNGNFTIVGNALRITQTANFEGQQSYSVRIRATDTGNAALTVDRSLGVSVTNVNEPPTNLALDDAFVAEQSAIGTTVGLLTISDPDAGTLPVYTLVPGPGDDDNGSFTITGAALVTAKALDYETKSSYTVRIRAADGGGPEMTTETTLAVTVTDVDEEPGDIALTSTAIAENNIAGAYVGTLTVNDPLAAGPVSFALASGTGDTDNGSFSIQGTSLRLNASADFEAKSSYHLRVRATDSGNPALSHDQSLVVSINDVNEPPRFTKGANQVALATSGTAYTIPNWATGIDDGDSGATQNLTFQVSVQSGATLFSALPTVSPAGTLAFTTNGTLGTAYLTIRLSDDSSINGTAPITTGTQAFAIETALPEIAVTGNALDIQDGDLVPQIADHTLFPLTAVGDATVVRTFTIWNTGGGNLSISHVLVDGINQGDFTVTSQPGSPIAPQGSAAFQVTFNPSADGLRRATLSLANSDADENPFNFAIEGNGGSPDIMVEESGQTLSNGTATMVFGEVAIGSSKSRTVTIRNTGTVPMTGLGLSLDNSHSGEFSVTQLTEDSLGPSASTTFTVSFTPTTTAPRTAILAIGSSDPDENPFTIALVGRSEHRLNKPISSPGSIAPDPDRITMPWGNHAAGTFDGLLFESGTLAGAISALRVTAPPALSPHGGSVSGTIRLKGVSTAIKGVFDLDGRLVSAIGAVPAFDLRLERTLTNNGAVIRGTVTHNGTTATADLPKAAFSTAGVPLELASTGPYTVILPSSSGSGLAEPGGDGWATAVLSNAGVFSVSATLGDGTKFTETAYLSADGQASLYADLYATNPGKGMIGGVLTFRPLTGSDCDGQLQWRKGRDTRVRGREKLYPEGFDLHVWAIAAQYAPPPVGTRLLSQLADQHYNAEISFIGPTAPLATGGANDKVLSWLKTNSLVHYGPINLTATATRTTGALTGSFHDPISKLRVAFSGVAYQKQGIAAGVFVNGSASGAVRILPGTQFDYPGSEAAGPLARLVKPGTSAADPLTTAVTGFPSSAAGSYGAILNDSNGTVAGALENVIVTGSGAISGTLWIDGIRSTVRGSVGIPITVGDVEVTLNVAAIDNVSDAFVLQGSATVTGGGPSYSVSGERRPVLTLASPSPLKGAYTMAVCAPEPIDVDSEPGGDSYGTLTVSFLGNCSGLVTLADGSKVTLAGHHGSQYIDAGTPTTAWSFHRGLYGRTPKGYVVGKLTFRNSGGLADLDGTWRWVKQPLAAPATIYPAGIDTTRQVLGSLYLAPANNVRAMSGLDDANDNVWIRFAGPDMSTQVPPTITTKDFPGTWRPNNTIIHYGPQTISVTYKSGSGLLTGSYVDAANGINLKFGGVLIQDQVLLSGSYLSQGKSGMFIIQPRNP